MAIKHYDEAISVLKALVNSKIVDTVNPDEVAFALRHLGRACGLAGDPANEIAYLESAVRACPADREACFRRAEIALNKNDWVTAYMYSTLGLKFAPSHNYEIDPQLLGWRPLDFAAGCAARLGLNSEALQYAKRALSLVPQGEERARLENNIKRLQKKCSTPQDKRLQS